MNRQAVQTLKTYFGYDTFREGQESVVESILEHRDVLAIMPTGAGKSICYQVPALMLSGITIVISPLISLMQDQVKALNEAGIHAAFINSSLSESQISKALYLAAGGRYKIIYVAPERLENYEFLEFARQVEISMVTVDEAHCISQWGPDFRPAYLQLGRVRAQLHVDAVLALTATAPNQVRSDILKQLAMQNPNTIADSVDRPNIFLGVEMCQNEQEKHQRLDQLLQANVGPTIIYCATRAAAENLATVLKNAGLKAAFYHAGLDSHQRDLIQRQFQFDQLQVICATSAFGMGIDKANVRLVVHLYVPESLEAYYQAIGRAGRDGAASLAAMIVTQDDLNRSRGLAGMLPDQTMIQTVFAHPDIYRDFDDPQINLIEAYIAAGFSLAQTQQQLQHRLAEKQTSFMAMAAFVNESGCRRAWLLKHFDSPSISHHAFCCGPVTAEVLEKLETANVSAQLPPKHWQAVFRQIFR